MVLNAASKEETDINDVINTFRQLNETQSPAQMAVIERLERAATEGKTMYTAEELTALFQ